MKTIPALALAQEADGLASNPAWRSAMGDRLRHVRKKIARAVMPRYSRSLDLINYNALLGEWLREHRGVPCFPDKFRLYEFLSHEVVRGEPIDYLEFGVYTGGTFRHWLDLNRCGTSRFFGFDSFEGLPEQWNKHYPQGTFAMDGTVPQVNDARARFIKGWFHESLPAFLLEFDPRNRLVIHNDSDLYSSTLCVLAQLDRLIRPGTLLIFDEFSSPLHEFRAYRDYSSAFRRVAVPVAMSGYDAGQVAFEFR